MYRFLRLGVGFLLTLALVAPGSAGAVDGGTTAATAILLPASLSATTTIVGSSGGAYFYYTFTSPSTTSAASLTVGVNPSSPPTAPWSGVNLYQAGSTIASTNAVNASTPGAPNSISFAVASGPVLVQVYNFLSGQPSTITFTMNGIGPAAPTSPTASSSPTSPTVSASPVASAPIAPSVPVPSSPTPTTSGQPARFVVASPSTLIAWGTLVGSSGGAYSYYTFNSPANRATGTVTLVVSPRDPVTNSTVGVILFQGGYPIASLNTASAVPGVNSAGFPLSTAGPVVVQVYNYQPGATAVYTIVISGTGVTP